MSTDENSDRNLLSQILNLKTQTYLPGMPVGRFRDIYISEGKDGLEIHLYTRTGGDNRQCIKQGCAGSHSTACDCYGCIQTYLIPTHPYYLGDSDCEYDCTYATTRFSVPPKHERIVNVMYEAQLAAEKKASQGTKEPTSWMFTPGEPGETYIIKYDGIGVTTNTLILTKGTNSHETNNATSDSHLGN